MPKTTTFEHESDIAAETSVHIVATISDSGLGHGFRSELAPDQEAALSARLALEEENYNAQRKADIDRRPSSGRIKAGIASTAVALVALIPSFQSGDVDPDQNAENTVEIPIHTNPRIRETLQFNPAVLGVVCNTETVKEAQEGDTLWSFAENATGTYPVGVISEIQATQLISEHFVRNNNDSDIIPLGPIALPEACDVRFTTDFGE